MSRILAQERPPATLVARVPLAAFILFASSLFGQIVPPAPSPRGPVEMPGVYIVRLRQGLVPGLNAVQSSSGPTSLLLPAGTAAGNYYIIGKADADSIVPETLESNNTRAATFKVTAP